MCIEPGFISVATGNPMLAPRPRVPNASAARVPGTMSPASWTSAQAASTARFATLRALSLIATRRG